MPNDKSTIVELQALRGLAASVVLVGHAMGYYATPAWFARLVSAANGYASVVIFFVLSGFVLARSLMGREFNRSTVAAFYVKRLFRLYPALWVASALALVYVLFIFPAIPPGATSSWFHARFETGGQSLALLVLGSFAGALAYLVPPSWSISVEFVGSFAMPYLTYLLGRRRRFFWFVAAILLAISVTVGRLTPHAFASYMVDFALGAAILSIPDRIAARLRESRGKYAVLVLCVAVLASDRVLYNFGEHDPLAHMIELSASVVIVALLVHGGLKVSLLRSRPAVLVGDVSYSLYLLHFPVLSILGWLLGPGIPFGNAIAAAFLLTAMTLVVTIPLSWLAYTLIERTGIRTGGALARQWAEGRLMEQPAGSRLL